MKRQNVIRTNEINATHTIIHKIFINYVAFPYVWMKLNDRAFVFEWCLAFLCQNINNILYKRNVLKNSNRVFAYNVYTYATGFVSNLAHRIKTCHTWRRLGNSMSNGLETVWATACQQAQFVRLYSSVAQGNYTLVAPLGLYSLSGKTSYHQI